MESGPPSDIDGEPADVSIGGIAAAPRRCVKQAACARGHLLIALCAGSGLCSPSEDTFQAYFVHAEVTRRAESFSDLLRALPRYRWVVERSFAWLIDSTASRSSITHAVLSPAPSSACAQSINASGWRYK